MELDRKTDGDIHYSNAGDCNQSNTLSSWTMDRTSNQYATELAGGILTAVIIFAMFWFSVWFTIKLCEGSDTRNKR